MRTIRLIRRLGFSRSSRMKTMEENIRKSAEDLYEQGVNTRIPFLKKAFLKESVVDGPSAKKDLPISECEFGQLIPSRFRSDVLRVQRFNIFRSQGDGMVGVPITSCSSPDVRIVAGKTTYVADLLFSAIPLLPEITKGNIDLAAYSIGMHHIFYSSDGAPLMDPVVQHEFEHASHHSLSRLSGFSTSHVPFWKAEYLAHLRELDSNYSPRLPHLLMGEFERLKDSKALPHLTASAYFLYRLQTAYKMKLNEIKSAISAYQNCDDNVESLKLQPGYGHLEEMIKFGAEEYRLMYAHLFGISYGDIQEVVSNVPLIRD